MPAHDSLTRPRRKSDLMAGSVAAPIAHLLLRFVKQGGFVLVAAPAASSSSRIVAPASSLRAAAGCIVVALALPGSLAVPASATPVATAICRAAISSPPPASISSACSAACSTSTVAAARAAIRHGDGGVAEPQRACAGRKESGKSRSVMEVLAAGHTVVWSSVSKPRWTLWVATKNDGCHNSERGASSELLRSTRTGPSALAAWVPRGVT